MVNLKKLKKKLTAEQIIKVVESLGGSLAKQNDKELIFTSICCKNHPESHKPKLYYYMATQSWYCYKCQNHGDIFELVKTVWSHRKMQYTFMAVVTYICDLLQIDSGIFDKPSIPVTYDWQSALGKYSKFTPKTQDLIVYNDDVLNFFPEIYHQSWIDEGISIKTMKKFGIRFYPLHDSIIIPATDDNGNLIGIRERFLRPENVANGKYKPLRLLDGTQYAFPTNQVFYGIEQNIQAIKSKKIVWLCEGEKSVLKFDTWFGKDNVALAMYGSNLGKRRRNYLTYLGVDEIVIMLDSDFHEYGDEEYNMFEKKVFNIGKQLKGFFKVSVCYNNQGYDGYKFAPCDFTREQFDKMYEEREYVE